MSGEVAPVGALSECRDVAALPGQGAVQVERVAALPGEGAVVKKASVDFFEKEGVGYMVQFRIGTEDGDVAEMLETEPLHVLGWYITQNLGGLLGQAAAAWAAFRPTLVKQMVEQAGGPTVLVDAAGHPIAGG